MSDEVIEEDPDEYSELNFTSLRTFPRRLFPKYRGGFTPFQLIFGVVFFLVSFQLCRLIGLPTLDAGVLLAFVTLFLMWRVDRWKTDQRPPAEWLIHKVTRTWESPKHVSGKGMGTKPRMYRHTGMSKLPKRPKE